MNFSLNRNKIIDIPNINIDIPNINYGLNRNKIIDIPDIYIITNGSIEELKLLNKDNINIVGKVVDKKNNNFISEITPLIMILNQNKRDYKQRIKVLIDNGADFEKKINYYGKETSAYEIAKKFRNY